LSRAVADEPAIQSRQKYHHSDRPDPLFPTPPKKPPSSHCHTPKTPKTPTFWRILEKKYKKIRALFYWPLLPQYPSNRDKFNTILTAPISSFQRHPSHCHPATATLLQPQNTHVLEDLGKKTQKNRALFYWSWLPQYPSNSKEIHTIMTAFISSFQRHPKLHHPATATLPKPPKHPRSGES
jgi:hypothetical protein